MTIHIPEYKNCPKCGSKLDYKIPNEFDHEKRYVCSECEFIFYQNSKPTASAVIVDDDNNVLLVKRAYEPRTGYWDVAGGFLEYAEHPHVGVKREVMEELNVEIEIIDLLDINMDYYETTKDCTINIYYLAKIISGEPKASSDVAGYKWFECDELPEEMAFDGNEKALQKFKEKYCSDKL